MSYEDPVNQRSMVLDSHRNAAYQKALEDVITPESVVMDLGAGLGVLGLMAAQLGAAKVYLVEPATNLTVAMEIAASNGLSERVVPVQSTIEQASIEDSVDIIVSVFTGNFLLEEDLLPSLFYARDEYLKPGGQLLPDLGRMMVQPVSLPEYWDGQMGGWHKKASQISFDVMQKYAVNSLYYDQFNDKQFTGISPARELHLIDFYQAGEAACRASVEFVVARAQMLHGFLGWFDMSLGGDWLSTGPNAAPTHWSQVLLPVDAPIYVEQGEVITLKLSRPERGEWSWQIVYRGERQNHSTFLSRPNSPAELARRSSHYKPGLSEQGEITIEALRCFDRRQSAEDISAAIYQRWPDAFVDANAARRFVQQLILKFGHV